jgi:DNA-binding transcriptional regulator YiaG
MDADFEFRLARAREEGVELGQSLLTRMVGRITDLPRRLQPKELRFLRTQMGWSQQLFADHLGVDRVTVCRWESEKENQKPKPHTDFVIRFVWVQSRLAADSERPSSKLSKKRTADLARVHAALAQILGHLGVDEHKPPKRMVVDVPKMQMVA